MCLTGDHACGAVECVHIPLATTLRAGLVSRAMEGVCISNW